MRLASEGLEKDGLKSAVECTAVPTNIIYNYISFSRGRISLALLLYESFGQIKDTRMPVNLIILIAVQNHCREREELELGLWPRSCTQWATRNTAVDQGTGLLLNHL